MPNDTIDFGWFRSHLLDDILPNWLRSSATAEGVFLPRLDRQWRPQAEQVATLVSQCRLLYNFARREFVDHEHGGWYSGPWTPAKGISNHTKGSEWKVDYHAVGMCVEALRPVGDGDRLA